MWVYHIRRKGYTRRQSVGVGGYVTKNRGKVKGSCAAARIVEDGKEREMSIGTVTLEKTVESMVRTWDAIR
jgi:hypothetical protein